MLRAAAGYSVPAPPASTDPQFNYVTMLLHGDGTNGAQNNTFVDSSTNNFTITRNGTPTQGSFSPYGDLWSNYFGGVSDWMTVPASANTNVLGGDFTIECWFYPLSFNVSNNNLLVMQDNGNSSNQNFQLTALSTGAIKFTTWSTSARSSFWEITTTSTAPLNFWNHIAVTRSGTTTRVFLNGVQQVSSTNSVWAGASIQTCIGNWSSGPNQTTTYSKLNGYVSNVRIVKGTALYTSAFTPPTTPLTAVSGTSLLTCQSNRFRDNSSNNFAITVTGTPSVQRFSPFDPAAEYSTSVIGGSGFMTGTQYLLLGGQSAFSFDADFTVELWFYALGAGTGTPKLYESRGSGQEGVYVTIEHSGTSLVFRMSSAARITTTFAYNTWNHVALVRSSGVITMYLNGVSAGTYSTSATTLVGTSRPCIGAYPGFDNFNGYMSNVRIVKGTAVYTAAFTPPTAPLTAITNTSLLLNTVNAGIFDNAMMNDLVTVGNAQVSTSVKKYGTGSMAFDGSGDYLTIPNSVNLTFGTGDFTVEAWVNLNVLGSDRSVIDFRSSTNSFGALYISGSGNVIAFYDGSVTASGTSLTAGSWNHVAWVRVGTTLYGYLNGVQQWSRTLSTNITTIGSPKVGADYNGSLSQMNGYIDDLRITKGYARYTANFTPPTAAFPNN